MYVCKRFVLHPDILKKFKEVDSLIDDMTYITFAATGQRTGQRKKFKCNET